MSNRTTAIGIFLLAFAAFAWLAPGQATNAQVVTRLGLTLSIVDSGQLSIDRFADATIDKARFDGRYYTDKVPGLSFLAIPIVCVTKFYYEFGGRALDSNDRADFWRFARVATISVNGLISALAVAVLFLTAIRLGATRTGALFAAGVLALATPFFGWSTIFFAHSVSGSLLMFAGAAIVFAFAGDTSREGRPPSMLFGVGLGMLLGYTMVVDLVAAPTCLLGGILASALALRLGADVFVRVAGGMALGGILGLLPLLLYNQLAFGSPFKVGYSEVVGFEGMKQGFFGITWPKLNVLWELLFGLYRGLLPLSPILVLIPLGLSRMWREPATRIAAVTVILVICSFLWINASYYMWWGGWSTGPRHLVPMLPICCLPLAFACPRTFPGLIITTALLGASLVLALICAVADITAPENFGNPLVDYLLPRFLTQEKLLWSLPIIAIWGLFAALLLGRKDQSRRATESLES